MAPLFRNALALAEQRSDGATPDDEDTHVEDALPQQQSARLSQQSHPPAHSYTIAQPGKFEKVRAKDRSKARRNLAAAPAALPAHRPRLKALTQYHDTPAQKMPLESRELPAGSWIGHRTPYVQPKTWMLDKLLALDMEQVRWDGWCVARYLSVEH